MTLSGRIARLLVVPAALALAHPARGAEPPPARGPIERVHVDLILVDVEVRDAAGRPLRGLTAADFQVKVNGVPRALYSADDRCACRETASTREAAAPGRPSSGEPDREALVGGNGVLPAPGPAAAAPGGDPARFIFYFDFALMDLDGRLSAIKEARRWIRETMRDGDEVMIVGSTYALGAVTLAGMTPDRAMLQAALDRLQQGREFVDPHFPFLYKRRLECDDDHRDPLLSRTLPHCNEHANDEYQHTRRTLKVLSRFMQTLEPEGRKQLVLFHQVAPYRPAALYPDARLRDTQESAVQDVGASAVASHVAIHAAGTEGADLVARLAAEYTGGTYNRSRADLSRMLDEARSRCECLYRLGIEPLEKEKGRAVELTVLVRNRSVANMRVAVRTAADRWLQQARYLLSNPAAARDVPLHAALIPIAATARGWSAKVQVALHAPALTQLPAGGGRQAEWEVGARLSLEGSARAWDMLAVSSMSGSASATAPEWFVHEQTLTDLPPGTYRLGSFVRDRSVDLFGAASSVLDLPDPRGAGTIGPIPLLAGRRILTVDLPLQPAPARGQATRGVPEPSGLVPPGAAVAGENGRGPFEILTWLCGVGTSQTPAPGVERSIGFGDEIVMSYPPEGEWTEAGTCLRLSDTVEAGLLDDAPYTYHLRWKRPGDAGPLDLEAELP